MQWNFRSLVKLKKGSYSKPSEYIHLQEMSQDEREGRERMELVRVYVNWLVSSYKFARRNKSLRRCTAESCRQCSTFISHEPYFTKMQHYQLKWPWSHFSAPISSWGLQQHVGVVWREGGKNSSSLLHLRVFERHWEGFCQMHALCMSACVCLCTICGRPQLKG